MENIAAILPDSTYPSEVAEYLQWDDDKVIAKIKERVSVFPPAKRFMDRRVKSCVYETTAHSGGGTDDQVFGIIKRMLKEKLGYEPDCDAANKLAHKIPVLEWYDMDSGRGVPILTGYSHKLSVNDRYETLSALTPEEERTVDEIIGRYKAYKPAELELLTTAIYAYEHLREKSRANVMAGVKKIKGEKFSDVEIEEAMREFSYFGIKLSE